MRFKYYRHATFLLTINNTRILVDPMYMKKGHLPPIPSTLYLHKNPLEDFPGPFPRLSEKDILLITHHHFDHFDKRAALEIPKDVPVVSPLNGVKRLHKIGFQNSAPMLPGQESVIGDICFHAMPVKHSQRFNKLLYKPGLGYVLRHFGRNIYISGDTILFEELMARLKEFPPDMAVFYGGGARIPVLGRHTLSHREILSMIQDLCPRRSAVIHLNGLNHCREDRASLSKLLDSSPSDSKVILPLPGEEFRLD